ncbi:MAG: PqiC family protein [Bacteroidetes bacterium]|nr:PqiC family protein [Bacteroidota bacterium]
MNKILIVFLALLLFSSCSSEKIVPKYYALNPIDLVFEEEDVEDLGLAKVTFEPLKVFTLPYEVNISPVRVANAYEQNKIAVRTKRHEMQYYYYHLWSELPSTSITFLLDQYIRDAKLFKLTHLYSQKLDAKYQLNSIVEQLERIDIEDKYSAHLKMSFQLIDLTAKEIVLTYNFDRYLPLEESTPMNVYAIHINRILYEESRNLILKISQTLSK